MKPSIRKLLVSAGLAGLAGLSLAAGTPGAGSEKAAPAKSEKEVASVQPAASPAAKKDVKKHATKSPATHKDSAAKPAKAASGA